MVTKRSYASSAYFLQHALGISGLTEKKGKINNYNTKDD